MVQPTPFLLRPIVFEYIVTGNLDGVTPAPPVTLPPDPSSPVTPGQFIRQVIVNPDGSPKNLGLIDLTRGGQFGAYAGRIIKWIEVLGPNVPVGGDNVGVAFDNQLQRADLEIPATANGIFSRNCIFVPQTAQLLLQNMNSSPGQPILVRIAVWQPKSLEELTAIIEACCCLAECVNGFDEPCFTHALYDDVVAAGLIDSVNPAAAARGSTEIHTVLGSDFGPDDVFQVFLPVSSGSKQVNAVVTDVVIVNDGEATVTVEYPPNIPLGAYSIAVAPSLGGQYAFTLSDAIDVT